MCTAIHLSEVGLFGRTLDFERSFGESLVFTPREHMQMGEARNRYAILGVGLAKEGATLYYDGMNEWGLCGAALNFPGYAVYQSGREDKASVPSGMILSFVLGFCKNINQIRDVFSNIGISDDALFNLPPASLHWIFADKTGAITVESTERGLEILDNPYGVLTNAPNFSYHTTRLGDYMVNVVRESVADVDLVLLVVEPVAVEVLATEVAEVTLLLPCHLLQLLLICLMKAPLYLRT